MRAMAGYASAVYKSSGASRRQQVLTSAAGNLAGARNACISAPSLAIFALAAVQRLPDNGLSGTLPDAALGALTDYLIGIDLHGK